MVLKSNKLQNADSLLSLCDDSTICSLTGGKSLMSHDMSKPIQIKISFGSEFSNYRDISSSHRKSILKKNPKSTKRPKLRFSSCVQTINDDQPTSKINKDSISAADNSYNDDHYTCCEDTAIYRNFHLIESCSSTDSCSSHSEMKTEKSMKVSTLIEKHLNKDSRCNYNLYSIENFNEFENESVNQLSQSNETILHSSNLVAIEIVQRHQDSSFEVVEIVGQIPSDYIELPSLKQSNEDHSDMGLVPLEQISRFPRINHFEESVEFFPFQIRLHESAENSIETELLPSEDQKEEYVDTDEDLEFVVDKIENVSNSLIHCNVAKSKEEIHSSEIQNMIEGSPFSIEYSGSTYDCSSDHLVSCQCDVSYDTKKDAFALLISSVKAQERDEVTVDHSQCVATETSKRLLSIVEEEYAEKVYKCIPVYNLCLYSENRNKRNDLRFDFKDIVPNIEHDFKSQSIRPSIGDTRTNCNEKLKPREIKIGSASSHFRIIGQKHMRIGRFHNPASLSEETSKRTLMSDRDRLQKNKVFARKNVQSSFRHGISHEIEELQSTVFQSDMRSESKSDGHYHAEITESLQEKIPSPIECFKTSCSKQSIASFDQKLNSQIYDESSEHFRRQNDCFASSCSIDLLELYSGTELLLRNFAHSKLETKVEVGMKATRKDVFRYDFSTTCAQSLLDPKRKEVTMFFRDETLFARNCNSYSCFVVCMDEKRKVIFKKLIEGEELQFNPFVAIFVVNKHLSVFDFQHRLEGLSNPLQLLSSLQDFGFDNHHPILLSRTDILRSSDASYFSVGESHQFIPIEFFFSWEQPRRRCIVKALLPNQEISVFGCIEFEIHSLVPKKHHVETCVSHSKNITKAFDPAILAACQHPDMEAIKQMQTMSKTSKACLYHNGLFRKKSLNACIHSILPPCFHLGMRNQVINLKLEERIHLPCTNQAFMNRVDCFSLSDHRQSNDIDGNREIINSMKSTPLVSKLMTKRVFVYRGYSQLHLSDTEALKWKPNVLWDLKSRVCDKKVQQFIIAVHYDNDSEKVENIFFAMPTCVSSGASLLGGGTNKFFSLPIQSSKLFLNGNVLSSSVFSNSFSREVESASNNAWKLKLERSLLYISIYEGALFYNSNSNRISMIGCVSFCLSVSSSTLAHNILTISEA
jgi:hypothetical protein